MRRIVVVNQKGGCGKTTTAINIASCLSKNGKKILLLDMDPQGHVSLGLGVLADELSHTMYEVLLGDISISDATLHIHENLDLVPSNVILSAFELKMAGSEGREYLLANSLTKVRNSYDYLIIDCPPSLGLLTFNAMISAEEALVPVDCSAYSIKALEKLIDTIELIKEQTGNSITYRILPTNIDLRTRFSRATLETLKDKYPTHCLETFIHTSTRLREAAMHGKPISDYDERSVAFQDYMNLTKEIMHLKPLRRKKIPYEKIFSLIAQGKTNVEIAGDFNSWCPEPLKRVESEDGFFFQKAVLLEPGAYQYKYLIDGKWKTDPTNDKKVKNSFGSINSLIRI